MKTTKWYYCAVCNKWFGTLGLTNDKVSHITCGHAITACASGYRKPAKPANQWISNIDPQLKAYFETL